MNWCRKETRLPSLSAPSASSWIFALHPHGRPLERLRGMAARLGRRGAVLPFHDRRVAALRLEIGDMRLPLVFDADERSGKARDLEFFRHHQRHRLAAEANPVVV